MTQITNVIVDGSGITRLQGDITGLVDQLSGAGSPVATATATFVGQEYTDLTTGALWKAALVGTAGWVCIGGSNGSGVGPQLTDVAVDSPGSGWEVDDTNGSPGIKVVDSTVGPTTGPKTSTNLNVLDDGVAGAAVFANAVTAYGKATPGAQSVINGALSTVADAPAKTVLTSIIAALVAYGYATDGTT